MFKKKMTTLGYGIPQSWCRVYLHCGHQSRCQEGKIQVAQGDQIFQILAEFFLETSKRGEEKMNLRNYEEKYGKNTIWNDAYVLDVGSSHGFQSAAPHKVPCLTRTRMKGKETGYYIPRLFRRLNSVEGVRLQGILSHLAAPMVKATSDSVVRAACGDSMSLNVLGKVILATLVAIGKVAPNNALHP